MLRPAETAAPSDLIPRLQRYDAAAWSEAFDLLYPIAMKGARHAHAGLPPEDMEELASDAIADTARYIAGLPTWQQVTAFAFVAARRKTIDRLRRLRAQKRHSDTVSMDIDQIAHDAVSPPRADTLARWAEIAATVERLISGLGEPAASLVRGYTEEGLSHGELSRRAGIPVGTVAATIYRGMRRLERQLSRSAKLAKELRLYLRLLL